MAAATAPGPRAPAGESGGSAASALSMERIQSLTDLADLEAAYSRLCEEEVRGGRAREAAGPSVGRHPGGCSLLQPPPARAVVTGRAGDLLSRLPYSGSFREILNTGSAVPRAPWADGVASVALVSRNRERIPADSGSPCAEILARGGVCGLRDLKVAC